MGDNGISMSSREEISGKVARALRGTRGISVKKIHAEILKETGFPVDAEDLQATATLTLHKLLGFQSETDHGG